MGKISNARSSQTKEDKDAARKVAMAALAFMDKRLAYIKPVWARDLPEPLASQMALPPETRLYALCASDSAPIMIFRSPDQAKAVAKSYEMKALTLH